MFLTCSNTHYVLISSLVLQKCFPSYLAEFSYYGAVTTLKTVLGEQFKKIS